MASEHKADAGCGELVENVDNVAAGITEDRLDARFHQRVHQHRSSGTL